MLLYDAKQLHLRVRYFQVMSVIEAPSRKIDIVLLAIIFVVGIFLRITPQAFAPDATLHFLAPLHPQPAFVRLGFDEELYRKYTNGLVSEGLAGYPAIVQAYMEVVKDRAGSILPPL